MSRVVMSFVCIYYIIFILLSHGFIPGLSALSQSYSASRFSWPVEYRKWHPLLKKRPCLINVSFPFTMLNLHQMPLSNKHPLSNQGRPGFLGIQYIAAFNFRYTVFLCLKLGIKYSLTINFGSKVYRIFLNFGILHKF